MGKRPRLGGPPFRGITALFDTAQRSPADRLRIILGFATDPDPKPVMRWSLDHRARIARSLQFFGMDIPGWAPHGVLEAKLPSPRALEDIRHDLRRGVTRLLEGAAWIFAEPLTARVTADGVRLDGDFRARVLHGVAHQLVEHRRHIRRCKRCAKVFYGRWRAEYCSTACGQAFRDAKKRTARQRRSRKETR